MARLSKVLKWLIRILLPINFIIENRKSNKAIFVLQSDREGRAVGEE